MTWLRARYASCVLRQPLPTLVIVAAAIITVAGYTLQIRFDASSDSLVLENDDDLKYFRRTNARYQVESFVAIVYRPKKDVLPPRP